MTETEYFDALQELLDSRICQVPSAPGGNYLIQEPGQSAFQLSTRSLSSHKAIRLEKLPGGDWPCFKSPHNHAHKRCDSIVISWDKAKQMPTFLLVELKSQKPGDARKQLGASLAFCHFLHRMVCVGKADLPTAQFGAVTVMTLPFAQKALSTPTVPAWSAPNLQVDCPHMRYNRSHGSLPLAAVTATFCL
jgi:hypothetical protein